MSTTAAEDLGIEAYKLESAHNLLTPALVIYPDTVQLNIERTLALMDGDASRWRPHVKTAKLLATMRQLVEAQVVHMKCATTLELLTACEAGARDVLVAYAHTGANATRIVEIAKTYPRVQISVLIENVAQVGLWAGSPVGVFLDINPGMDRTGVAEADFDGIFEIVATLRAAGVPFRGLHYYDGQISHADLGERTAAAHRGYDRLLALVDGLESRRITVSEVITSGTPAFPCALSYTKFNNASFIHRVSPGTVVYNDASSLTQLPAEFGYRAAAVVLSRVISHPKQGVVTCDAGHKAVSVDKGVPNCLVLGHPNYQPMKPSEEHLPIVIPQDEIAPELGSLLYLLPDHICPTVNLFDVALTVRKNNAIGHEAVTARGHEGPLLP